MELTPTLSDIQHIAAIKLLFFVFLGAGLFGIYKKWRPIWFVILGSVLCALAYYMLVRGGALMFWGLQGDEITIAAMYEMFAHGSLQSDFAYAHLPPFYPPLFFWLFGLFGRIFSLNGVQIAKIGTLATILLYPVMFYTIQKWYWTWRTKQGNVPKAAAWLFSTACLFLFVDWAAIITKPYELISASLVVLWSIFLLNELRTHALTTKSILFFGLTGGILFLLFYFWFFLAAIGGALFLLFDKTKTTIKEYGQLLSIGAIIFLVGSVFWYPLITNTSPLGSEPWQHGYLLLQWFTTQGPNVSFTLVDLLILFGFVALIFLRHIPYIRMLLSFFVAAYVWQAMGLSTNVFFLSPLQETKGFHFFAPTIYALAAGFGAQLVLEKIRTMKNGMRHIRTAHILALFFIATQLLFGQFMDDHFVQQARARMRAVDTPLMELVGFLETRNVYEETTLHSSIVQLPAFVPLNSFIYYNINNSHPSANFSERLLFLETLGYADSPEEFYTLTQENQFAQIDRLILHKNANESFDIYFHVDNYPNGTKEYIVRIPQELVAEPYFTQVFETEKYVVYEPM